MPIVRNSPKNWRQKARPVANWWSKFLKSLENAGTRPPTLRKCRSSRNLRFSKPSTLRKWRCTNKPMISKTSRFKLRPTSWSTKSRKLSSQPLPPRNPPRLTSSGWRATAKGSPRNAGIMAAKAAWPLMSCVLLVGAGSHVAGGEATVPRWSHGPLQGL